MCSSMVRALGAALVLRPAACLHPRRTRSRSYFLASPRTDTVYAVRFSSAWRRGSASVNDSSQGIGMFAQIVGSAAP